MTAQAGEILQTLAPLKRREHTLERAAQRARVHLVPELTDGIVDMEVTSQVIREMPRVLRRIESFGVNFKDPRYNDYYRLRSFGLPGTYHINFDGSWFAIRARAVVLAAGEVNRISLNASGVP